MDTPSAPDSTPLRIDTLDACGLQIGRWPRFLYDGRGGGGDGALGAADDDGWQPLTFDPAGLTIPPLESRSTRVLGLPLPPGVRIAIEPEQLAGHLDPASGAIRLRFRARFHSSFAGLYRPPELRIDAELRTGAVTSVRHRIAGQPLDPQGEALLVGVAQVPPSGDALLDRFLGLPDEALAVLRCRFAPLARLDRPGQSRERGRPSAPAPPSAP